MVSSYRLSILIMSRSAGVWPQFAAHIFRRGAYVKFTLSRKLCKQEKKTTFAHLLPMRCEQYGSPQRQLGFCIKQRTHLTHRPFNYSSIVGLVNKRSVEMTDSCMQLTAARHLAGQSVQSRIQAYLMRPCGRWYSHGDAATSNRCLSV